MEFKEFYPDLIQATKETLFMLGIGLTIALIFGGLFGILLFLWRKDGLLQNKFLYFFVGGLVNVVRSFPFIILMIFVIPVTRTLTGTTIGPIAASVPLSISAIAYFARLVEIALNDVPKGVIESAIAMGASIKQIVFSVLLSEAKSSLILSFTTLTVSYISYTAIAGVVGGGGIGDLAIRYGYYRFETKVMVVTVIILVVFVQAVQLLGNFLAVKLNNKK